MINQLVVGGVHIVVVLELPFFEQHMVAVFPGEISWLLQLDVFVDRLGGVQCVPSELSCVRGSGPWRCTVTRGNFAAGVCGRSADEAGFEEKVSLTSPRIQGLLGTVSALYLCSENGLVNFSNVGTPRKHRIP